MNAHSSLVRRALFQVHLWTGIAIGLYVLLISLTGAALVFRIDLQRALHPDLFTAGPGELAAPAVVLDSLQRTWPRYPIAGIDAPTTARPTYLAYVNRDGTFRTALLDPVSARVLGLLPEQSLSRTLQNLHFDLLAGATGRIVNGIGAAALLLLCLTGAVIWWPGIERWRRGTRASFRQGPARGIRELHGATGFWVLLLLVMWAITGLYFAFPEKFRTAVSTLAPVSVVVTPRSTVAPQAEPRSWRELIAIAQQSNSGAHVARVVIPYGPEDAFQVLFASRSPTPAGERLRSVYLDQYSGAVLSPGSQRRTAGDVLLDWLGPLHTGSFGGIAVKLVWLLVGLTPALLFFTGFISWWLRVVRPRRAN